MASVNPSLSLFLAKNGGKMPRFLDEEYQSYSKFRYGFGDSSSTYHYAS
jgi:hypothetical protein